MTGNELIRTVIRAHASAAGDMWARERGLHTQVVNSDGEVIAEFYPVKRSKR